MVIIVIIAPNGVIAAAEAHAYILPGTHGLLFSSIKVGRVREWQM